MKIAIIGATGFVGSAVLNEALNLDHQVTVRARNIDKLTVKNDKLTTVSADADDSDNLAKILAGHDAIVSAYNAGWTNPNLYNDFIKGSEAIQQAAKLSGVKRLLVVGGAGSLEVAPGVQMVDTPEFPAQWKSGATAARVDAAGTHADPDTGAESDAFGVADARADTVAATGPDAVTVTDAHRVAAADTVTDADSIPFADRDADGERGYRAFIGCIAPCSCRHQRALLRSFWRAVFAPAAAAERT